MPSLKSNDSQNPQWAYIGREKTSKLKYDTAGYMVDVSKAELKEIRKTQKIDFIKNVIVFLTFLMVICGAAYVMITQLGERQGILPLNTYHVQTCNSHLGGLIRFVKADRTVVHEKDFLEQFISKFVSGTYADISDFVKKYQGKLFDEITRFMPYNKNDTDSLKNNTQNYQNYQMYKIEKHAK